MYINKAGRHFTRDSYHSWKGLLNYNLRQWAMVGEVLGGAGSLFVPVFYLWCKLRTNLFSSLQISATDHVNRVPGCSPCRGETSGGKGGGNYFKAFYCLCVLFQGCCLNCTCVLKLVLAYRMEETSERNCRWDKSGCFILVWVVFFFHIVQNWAFMICFFTILGYTLL